MISQKRIFLVFKLHFIYFNICLLKYVLNNQDQHHRLYLFKYFNIWECNWLSSTVLENNNNNNIIIAILQRYYNIYFQRHGRSQKFENIFELPATHVLLSIEHECSSVILFYWRFPVQWCLKISCFVQTTAVWFYI